MTDSGDLRRINIECYRLLSGLRHKCCGCRGRMTIDLPYRYLGTDDRAGPNYTGQPAVDLYYEPW